MVGISVIEIISGFDHWIAFGLLFVIGFRMIYESISIKSKKLVYSSSYGVLFLLSVATSIDALAIGLSLSLIETSIIFPVIVIGITSFLLSFLGVYLGKKFGSYFEKIGVIGGIILIGIAIKILIEHFGL